MHLRSQKFQLNRWWKFHISASMILGVGHLRIALRLLAVVMLFVCAPLLSLTASAHTAFDTLLTEASVQQADPTTPESPERQSENQDCSEGEIPEHEGSGSSSDCCFAACASLGLTFHPLPLSDEFATVQAGPPQALVILHTPVVLLRPPRG